MFYRKIIKELDRWAKRSGSFYKGKIAEYIVGQELLANNLIQRFNRHCLLNLPSEEELKSNLKKFKNTGIV